MADYQHLSHGFGPVFDERSRVLVLGSFPSVLSRKSSFYYGNPQNRFWRVIAACAGEPVPPNKGDRIDEGDCAAREKDASKRGLAATGRRSEAPSDATATVTSAQSVSAKRSLLLAHGIALWDVIESCDIMGSSDASIRNVEPVDVERVLGIAQIEAVFCNGGTAGRLYRRYLREVVGLDAVVLPSTSPANAIWSFGRLVARWSEALNGYLA